MEFTKLKLLGFKSFVDPVELDIKSGLTGIVGPNGCGKSNLLEALQWVMGETSYKNLRGSEMDDVIFAGTQNITARNMAEVTLTIDNKKKDCPPEYANDEVIEITRRIDRNEGSTYYINSKEKRAKDVQLFFADLSSGAHSVSLVRQGQISQIVAAKPIDRRKILEEAAGISGLHHRRHEAELRLDATLLNLERIDDVTGEINLQLSSLKRQSNQAVRFKKIAEEVRNLESLMLFLKWNEITNSNDEIKQKKTTLQTEVQDYTIKVSELSGKENKYFEMSKPIREQERQLNNQLQDLLNQDSNLKNELHYIREKKLNSAATISQIKSDIIREESNLKDQNEQMKLLKDKEKLYKTRISNITEIEQKASKEALYAKENLINLEEKYNKKTSELINTKAIRTADKNRIIEYKTELHKLKLEKDQLVTTSEDANKDSIDLLQKTKIVLYTSKEKSKKIEKKILEYEENNLFLIANEKNIQENLTEVRISIDRLETEKNIYNKILEEKNGGTPTLEERISVTNGYEKAIITMFEDNLEVTLDKNDHTYWRHMENEIKYNKLPSNTIPIKKYITGPKEIDLLINHVGLVERENGANLQKQLYPGQILVSIEGDLWRWDGYTSRAKEDEVGNKIYAKNRLEIIGIELTDKNKLFNAASKEHKNITTQILEHKQAEISLRDERRILLENQDELQNKIANIEQKLWDKKETLISQSQRKKFLEESIVQINHNINSCKIQLSKAIDENILEIEMEPLKRNFFMAKSNADSKDFISKNLTNEKKSFEDDLSRIFTDHILWEKRNVQTIDYIEGLRKRLLDSMNAENELSILPDKIEQKRIELSLEIELTKKDRNKLLEDIQEAELNLHKYQKLSRSEGSILSEKRELLAHTKAQYDAMLERKEDLNKKINTSLSCSPEEILNKFNLLEIYEKNRLNIEDIENKIISSKNQREAIGSVNLMAQEEYDHLFSRAGKLVTEKEDLLKAIETLKNGVKEINTEARQRLLIAFKQVNNNFQTLFKKLFSGGEAELKLIGSDDPLEAGLDIIAWPPGKKPQTISLLSGGEQALTAFALILGVFQTNPAPICVLDEVDAPLDDSNIQRFSDLIKSLTEETKTRFLIITHHPYTMSSMHRLFGVTMIDQGVSKLVSVDLRTAENLIDK